MLFKASVFSRPNDYSNRCMKLFLTRNKHQDPFEYLNISITRDCDIRTNSVFLLVSDCSVISQDNRQGLLLKLWNSMLKLGYVLCAWLGVN